MAHRVTSSRLVILPCPREALCIAGFILNSQTAKLRPTEEGGCLAPPWGRSVAGPPSVQTDCDTEGRWGQIFRLGLRSSISQTCLYGCLSRTLDRLAQALNTAWSSVEVSGLMRLEREVCLFRAPGKDDKSWGGGAQASCLIRVLYPCPSYGTSPSGSGPDSHAGGGREVWERGLI